jgi:hypothetical protein
MIAFVQCSSSHEDLTEPIIGGARGRSKIVVAS